MLPANNLEALFLKLGNRCNIWENMFEKIYQLVSNHTLISVLFASFHKKYLVSRWTKIELKLQ